MGEFTELAKIQDLRKYNLDELKLYLGRWHFEIIDTTLEFLDVRFTEDIVIIDLRYSINGAFVQILCEEWKGLAIFDFRK